MSRRGVVGGGSSGGGSGSGVVSTRVAFTSTAGAATSASSGTLGDGKTHKTRVSVIMVDTTGNIRITGEWTVITKRVAGVSSIVRIQREAEWGDNNGTDADSPFYGDGGETAVQAVVSGAYFVIASNKLKFQTDPVNAHNWGGVATFDTEVVANP